MEDVLIIAYQISPFRGSEYSVAWNHVSEMSKFYKLTVIYGTSGDHLGMNDDLELWRTRGNDLPNVEWVFLAPTLLTKFLNFPNERNFFKYSFYFAYNSWHKQLFHYLKKNENDIKFRLIHFLNPIGYREPGYLWKLDCPYIWGPIGGMNTVPINILNLLSLKDKLPFYIRTVINWIQIRFHIRLKRAVMNSQVLLVSTTEIKDKVRRRFNITSQYLPENGILELKRNSHFSFNLESGIVNLVWIGRLDSLKYLDLLLEALNRVISKNWKLNVIGSGPRQKELVNRSSVLGLSNNIVWHGNIPRSSVFEILKDMHLNIITSLSEGNPTTLWEVMSYNIPTITLNHCGMKDVVCNRCGIKIEITNINQIIKDVSSNIEHLLKKPNEILKLSEGVEFCSQTHLWSERVKKIDFIYKSVIRNN